MGGPNSGRWKKHEPAFLVEDCVNLDVGQLNDEEGLVVAETPWGGGNLEVGYRWTKTGITFTAGVIQEDVVTTSTPQSFGGSRRWFLCPNRGCGRRVRNLYLPMFGDSQSIACRRCHDLVYRSAQKAHDREMESVVQQLSGLGLKDAEIRRSYLEGTAARDAIRRRYGIN